MQIQRRSSWIVVCAILFLAAASIASPAQTYTSLYSFCSLTNCDDGSRPTAGLVQGVDGNLYGTTVSGGTNGVGTAFKISTSGTLTTLHSFNGSDGLNPFDGLLLAGDGNFYGTTFSGGNINLGNIFKMTPSGTVTQIYSFCPQQGCPDGAMPYASLVQGTDGNFYGTTQMGGDGSCSGLGVGCGVVFKVTPGGTLTVLHSFSGADGVAPYAGLVLGNDGNFYGTTQYGGAYNNCPEGSGLGCGTVFKITPGGMLTTLYEFCSQPNCADGYGPEAGLVQAADGNFYGTTHWGGDGLDGDGTAFQITSSGVLMTLHLFCSQHNCGDGNHPIGSLIQATDGNLYGTTPSGGANSGGTIFQMSTAGQLGTLYSFCSQAHCNDGSAPYGPLLEATDGNLYGTASMGGNGCNGGFCGTVFKLALGLTPFIETQPTMGQVGTPVTILGTNLTGASSVSFNGTPATFNVVSSSEITTTVPAGATTGAVRVTVGGNTLTSNTDFQVIYPAPQESVLYSFHPSGSDAAFPYYNGVIRDTNGNLYGLTYQGGAYDVGAVYELVPQQGGWTRKLLHSFGHSGDGTYPYGSLVMDAAGNLYGTTSGGGSHSGGTVFEVTPQSNGTWTETVIHNFGSGSDGRQPQAGLIFDSNGNLYGTTVRGGGAGRGTAFEMTPRQGGGWTETILHNFGNGSDGFSPDAPLIFDGTGNLYGTTLSGGTNFGAGTVFQMKPRQGGGWTESVIHDFGSDGADGLTPAQGLILDSNGNLFGATPSGGTNNYGVVFELSPAEGGGWTETIMHQFNENGTDGGAPFGSLVRDLSGNLYGTTAGGGSDRSGVVFELSPAQGGGWTETILYSFTFNGTDGVSPNANLIFDSAGNLYSTTAGGGIRNDGTVFELSPQQGGGWVETVLYGFIYSGSGGAFPTSTLIADSAGNLYGTTNGGGSYDSGIAFKLTPNDGGTWTETLLHNFGHGFDGTFPSGGLALDSNGNLYGTTESGGTHNCGAVFKISPHQGGGWTETVLHNFNCDGLDGYLPFGGVIFDGSGNLFGTTYWGGSHGIGTVFEMSPNGSGGWTERVVHNFNFEVNDGYFPYAGLIMDSSGNLFGTTIEGGSYGVGTVFEETPNGSGGFTERVLHNFRSDQSDGWNPYGGLVLDGAHNLYGTTIAGGTDSYGTVFQMTPQQNGTWIERVIHNFDGTYGSQPNAGLAFFGSSPNLYGTASSGGANGFGIVFQLAPTQGGNWTLSPLHDFNPASGDGGQPLGSVIFDANGNLYGTTEIGGGNYNAGTVFEITSAGSPSKP